MKQRVGPLTSGIEQGAIVKQISPMIQLYSCVSDRTEMYTLQINARRMRPLAEGGGLLRMCVPNIS